MRKSDDYKILYELVDEGILHLVADINNDILKETEEDLLQFRVKLEEYERELARLYAEAVLYERMDHKGIKGSIDLLNDVYLDDDAIALLINNIESYRDAVSFSKKVIETLRELIDKSS